MKRALGAALFIALAQIAFYSDTAFGDALRCHVIEHSDAGGTVEVGTDENPAPAWWPEGNKPQILWQPPPSPASPSLVLKFVDSTLKDIGNVPRGGHIRFRVPPPTEPDDTQVIIGLPGADAIIFEQEQLQYGSDYGSDDETRPAMDVGFGDDVAHWSEIKTAIMDGSHLTVKLVRNGKVLSEATFDLGNHKARDALLAQAAQKVASADPKVCTTAPLPIRDMTSGGS
jgi:hypothetical protein